MASERRYLERVPFVCALLMFVVFMCACGPPLPHDFDALAEMMNSNNLTVKVNAANRLTALYGSDGLLSVLRKGKPGARGLAALRLRNFGGSEVESALLDAIRRDGDSFVRANCLCSLAHLRSKAARSVAETMLNDPDRYVRYCAEEAVNAAR